ncbi:MAG TPA: sulfotransferase [Acidimicrobiia bacterium]|nr:sulfotransferase [Acidimicrobiia bacterium]
MPERAPFPFVVGCGRSGTTLMRALLDAHPQIAVPFESYFPVWFARDQARYERSSGFDVASFLDDLLAHESFARWSLDPEAVRTHLSTTAPANYPDAIRACFALYASAHGKPRYADKTPLFVTHIPLLSSLFPEAVFVHLVRDGRDVALSRTEVAWGTGQFAQEALNWRDQVEQGRRDGRALGDVRYCEVKYETLLDDPEAVARRLCEFIAVDFDPAMLRYHEQADAVLESQPFPDEHQNLRRPPTKGLRSWRADLEPGRVALFDCLAGRTLSRFGYERTTARPSVRTRLHALAAEARHTATNGYRRSRSLVWRAVYSRAAP